MRGRIRDLFFPNSIAHIEVKNQKAMIEDSIIELSVLNNPLSSGYSVEMKYNTYVISLNQ
jgi:hypothetical protein